MSRNARPHYRPGLGWILGVAFEDTLTRPVRLAQGFTFVRCHGSPRASSPHGLTAPGLASLDGIAACSCLWLAVATNAPREGLSPPIQCPCQAHLLDPACAPSGQQRRSAPRNGPSVSPRNDPKEGPHGPARIREGHEPPPLKFRDQKTPKTHPVPCSGSRAWIEALARRQGCRRATAGIWPSRRWPGSETVSDLAARHGVSRKFVYTQTDKARAALDDAFLDATPENDVMFDVAVTKTWLRQVIVALPLICHSSYRGVIEFMRDLLGVSVSMGTVHDTLQSAARQAGVINDGEDLSGIRVGLHDEIFQGPTPVLAGVDAASTYCYLLVAAQHRDADTWGVHLLDASQAGAEARPHDRRCRARPARRTEGRLGR